MLRLRVADRARGESLLEVVVAVTVLGIAAVAILSGMALSSKISDTHRKQATAAAYVRDYAEAIEATVAGGGYTSGAYPAFTPGTGYQASVLSKSCWTGSTWGSCSPDNGVQQLTLQVKSNDGRASENLVVVVRKPCTAAQAACS
jgi:type II secretory pathway pseudopilin PulG